MLKNISFLSAIKLKEKKPSKKSLKIRVQSWYVAKCDLNRCEAIYSLFIVLSGAIHFSVKILMCLITGCSVGTVM